MRHKKEQLIILNAVVFMSTLKHSFNLSQVFVYISKLRLDLRSGKLLN